MNRKKSQIELKEKIITFIKSIISNVLMEEKYGGTLLYISKDDHICGVFAYTTHVSIEFPFGYKLSDPDKKLLGGGKYRRHLKFIEGDENQWEDLEYFLRECTSM